VTTTPIVEPGDGDVAFYGKNCVAALVFKPGHWVVYAKVGRIWWCLDSMQNASFEQNPFDHQTQQQIINQLWFI